MVRYWVILLIGYWSLFTAVQELPTGSDEPVVLWLRDIIIDPLTFFITAILFLIGMITYSMVMMRILTRRISSNVVRRLLGLSLLISFIPIIHSNPQAALFCLLCLIIYGMISITRSREKETKRRQEGAE